jgi:hypothetical protein
LIRDELGNAIKFRLEPANRFDLIGEELDEQSVLFLK